VTSQFLWEALPARVVLGRGALDAVPAEVDRIGARRLLLVGGGRSSAEALARLRAGLGDRVAAVAGEVAAHVPEENAQAAIAQATAAGCDGVVSLGGGSATGLGKVVARAGDIPLLAVPTTYAGSEMTPIWGMTVAGRKTTGRDPRALPRTVVYDPDLCAGMPASLAAASGMNAMAHCAEALWSARRNPMTSALAAEGARRLVGALPRAVDDPSDVGAHAENLVGACLGGTSLAQTGTGVHHRTCHVLAGDWGLPHAETHAVVLPWAAALVAMREPDAAQPLRSLLGGNGLAAGLYAFARRLGLPSSLRELGLPQADIDEAVRRVVEALREDPFGSDADAVRHMVLGGWRGDVPA
jgi:maleylacetate reductase